MSRFLLFLALLALLIGIAVCAIAGLRLFQPSENTASPELMLATGDSGRRAAETYFAITLPPAPATDQFYVARKRDDYWLRINVQPDALRGLLADSPVLACDDLDLLDGLRPDFAFEELLTLEEQNALNWWMPDSAGTVVGSDCVGEDLTAYKILADSANPDTWIIYMEITRPEPV